jgi:hypothetical protein
VGENGRWQAANGLVGGRTENALRVLKHTSGLARGRFFNSV